MSLRSGIQCIEWLDLLIQVGRQSPIYLWKAGLNQCLRFSCVSKNRFSFATHEWQCRNSNRTTRPRPGSCDQDWEHGATARTLQINRLDLQTGFELHLSACLVLLAFLLLFALATPTCWPYLSHRLDDRAPRRHIHSIPPQYSLCGSRVAYRLSVSANCQLPRL
jgi:hypothetical protein